MGVSLRLTYAVTPPNRTTSLERRQALAASQSARLSALPIDALLVYDLQDEATRNGMPRPFPFVPKVDALGYAFDDLSVGQLPRVIYRTVAEQNEASFRHWLDRLQALGGRGVFVGAPSHRFRPSLTLAQAFSMCRAHTPALSFGGVMIAERHQTPGAEDVRMWVKMQQGCQFFVSQTVWSACATKQLLRDLCARAEVTGVPLPPILLTLSPCGSEQTLLFQEWLGVSVPPTLRLELLRARDMLERSVELAVETFAELSDFASEQGISVGCNVESVCARAVEIEASIELVRRIDRYQRRTAQADAARRSQHCRQRA
jgi:hypothetical protein